MVSVVERKITLGIEHSGFGQTSINKGVYKFPETSGQVRCNGVSRSRGGLLLHGPEWMTIPVVVFQLRVSHVCR